MPNSIAVFILFVLDWKYSFWGNLVQNIKIVSCSNLVPTIMVIIFWYFLVLYQILLSPKVKRSVIISNKHGIYQLPYELPKELGIRTHQGNVKTFWNYSLLSSLSPEIKILSIIAKSFWKIEIELFPLCSTCAIVD